MNTTMSDVLSFVRENDVKFIRLSFCDMFGFHKNISIMADELHSAFENGVSFDANAICGFRNATWSDLLLFPDPATLSVLPWRPGPGRVARFYCDIKNPDGSAFMQDSRYLLKQVVEQCETKGYICKIGAECEFYLFKTDEDGEPTSVTYDKGGYLDISPLDKCENIRRELCLTLEEMGLRPETSHHEQGPGQNEIDFRAGDVLSCGDNFQTYKSVIKAIAMQNGLYASFMPKPILDTAGSGLHVNISLAQKGADVFKNVAQAPASLQGPRPLARNGADVSSNANEGYSNIAEGFIAGILSKTPEITLFLNPLANSYERFGEFEAPKYVSWSQQNRSQLIRIPAAIGERARMELRSPDPSINPYLAFTLIIAAGLDGIANGMLLPPPVDADLYQADENITKTLASLPDSLDKAISLAKGSAFVKSVIGEEFLSKYFAVKIAEAADFAAAEDKAEFYKERYFNVT